MSGDHESDAAQVEIDLYAVLNVDRSASATDIKRAYLRLAVVLHPDKPTGDTAQFQRLGAAYAVLKDEAKRRAYDADGWSPELMEDWTESRGSGGSLSAADIEEFRLAYQGSEEEIADLLRIYTDQADSIRSLAELSANMWFGGVDSEARFRDILFAHVVAELIPKREEIFADEPPAARAKRLRAAEKEAREAEQLAEELKEKRKQKKSTPAIRGSSNGGGGGGGMDLVALIQSRNAARVAGFDAFEAKWAARAKDDDKVIDFGKDDDINDDDDDDEEDERPRRRAAPVRRGGRAGRGGRGRGGAKR
jgi:DnaJ family protein C protein 9